MMREILDQVVYVATDGNDANPGTLERPLASLEKARMEVRKLKKQGKSAIKVMVRGGTYYLKKPFTLTAEDSGSEEGWITYQAYPGETPVLSGGRKIAAAWQPYEKGIWECQLDAWDDLEVDFTQMFVNGKRQIRARYPNYDNSNPGVSGMLSPAKAELSWPHTQFHYDSQTFTTKSWAKPQEAVVHIFGKNYWGNLQWHIKDLDPATQTIYLGQGGFQINDIMQGEDATGIDHKSRYYIENVFEELDSPKEWYLNKETRKLYWMPESDADIPNALVEVPVLPRVIEFKGSQYNPVHHVCMKGFRIAHTTTTFFEEYEAPSLGDWTIHRGGAVYFEGTEHCSLEHCFLDAVGGNAVFLNNYNQHAHIYGNWIAEAGESAVCLVGSKHLTLGTNRVFPSDNIISNNLIHDIGVFGKQTAAVFISVSKDNTVSHNYIFNLPRAAICINDGTWGGHVIEFNTIHDTVRETSDHGPFNSWGRDRFWCLDQSHGPASHGAGHVKLDAQKPVIIRNNRFTDYSGWGIDLDDGSSNYHIYNNLCVGISIKLREGDFRTIENNIFVNGANPPGIHIGYEHNQDRFVRNIIVANSNFDNPEVDIDFHKGESKGKLYEFIGPPLVGDWVKEIDHNLFFNDIGVFLATVHFRPLGTKTENYDLQGWQELGFDRNSLYTDPLFVNPEQGDYTLRPESPAFQLGFKQFDLTKCGLLPDFSF